MSIKLNNAIYSLLTSDSGLTQIIGNKVFPLIIRHDEKLPYVVIQRYYDSEYSDDGVAYSNSTLEVTVFAETYNDSIEIAGRIDKILNFYRGTVGDNHIVMCMIKTCDEGYQDNAFLQKLTYDLKNY